MSETVTNAAPAAPQQRRVIGRPFKPGQSGNPAGRARGSRNRLADSFVADLRDCWERRGVEALEACATEHPEVLVKVIASLLPKTIDLNVVLDPADFAGKFRQAVALLHGERIEARPMKVIGNGT